MFRSSVVSALIAASGFVLATAPPPAHADQVPYSAHSMTHSCCTSLAIKDRMFREAKAMGAAYIRVDISLDEIFDVWTVAAPDPHWAGVDEFVALSRRYRMPVLAVFIGTPAHISECRTRWPQDHARCAATSPRRFGRYAARVVARAPDVFRTIEVWNEPDGDWASEGTAEQYAAMLRATYTVVKRRFPRVRVLIGGAMSLEHVAWYGRVLAATGNGGFDIASVHVRGSAASAPRAVRRWRAFFREHAHPGPVWVTETGYPSDPRFQSAPRYRSGDASQAAYLRDTLPRLVSAGAAQVFVTLRDGLGEEFGPESPFTSEGVLHLDESAQGLTVRRKPAFYAVRRLALAAAGS